ncbi:hypothetical protein D3C72_2229310 [compost metagenome]
MGPRRALLRRYAATVEAVHFLKAGLYQGAPGQGAVVEQLKGEWLVPIMDLPCRP